MSLSVTPDEAVVIHQRRNWQAASPFATHDAKGRPYRYGSADGLDAGIAPFVRILYDHGVETFESCEGGIGHAYAEPTVAFHGGPEAGPRAYAVARTHGLPVAGIRRCWRTYDGELVGPHWEITFYRRATDPTGAAPPPHAESLTAIQRTRRGR